MDFKLIIDFIRSTGIIDDKKSNFFNLPKKDKEAVNRIASTFSSGNNSIKFQSRASIAQYPVLVSDSLSFKTVQIVNGALEAQYASMLSLILQNSSMEADAQNAAGVVSKYHDNITHTPKDDHEFIRGAFNIKDEGVRNPYFLCGTSSVKNLQEANIELLQTFEETLNESTLNSISYTRDFMNILEESKGSTTKDKDDKDKGKKETTVNTLKLKDTDIKKANEITPTILTMKINFSDSGKIIEKEIAIGIKCVSHLILSDDIEYYLTKTAFKNSPIVRFIRWTTGEISFFKDLLFTIDDIKRSAIKNNSKNGFWWRKLETLSKISKANLAVGKNSEGKYSQKQPIPVTTMVISKEDVDNIKFRHGFNLLDNPKMVQKIVNNYFLLNFLIVDEGTDTIYMYNEETRDMDRYPKSAFQKMSSKDKFDVEELYKMLK